MRINSVIAMLAALLVRQALGGSVYVSTNSLTDGPGTSWSNAFRTIQRAVDASASSGTIWAADGVYASGGVRVPGFGLTNRVCLTNSVTLQSVNGPAKTFIVGRGPIGPAAVRGVYLTPGASITGFTITNGFTFPDLSFNSSEEDGGGVFLQGGGQVTRCIIAGNTCGDDGGGVCCHQGGTVLNCVIVGNRGGESAGGLRFTEGGLAENCTIVGNSDTFGAIYVDNAGTIRNSIIYYNTPGNVFDSGIFTVEYCCSTGINGPGCTPSAPQFVDQGNGNFRLQPTSPCIDTGTNRLAVVDDLVVVPRPLDGNHNGVARQDMGAFEFVDPASNSDGDAINDADEVMADTNPLDANSFLHITDLATSGEGTHIAWQGGKAATQFLERCTNLEAGTWAVIFTNLPPTVPDSFDIDSDGTNVAAFYRIKAAR